MSSNYNHNEIVDFLKKKCVHFVDIKERTEIFPTELLNGLELVDLDIFEVPSAFCVKNAVIACFNSPWGDGKEDEDYPIGYDRYYDLISDLRYISRPQYISLYKGAVKIMCWCDWA